MRVLLLSAVSLVLGASCLTVVEERWCDAARPCSAGFVCSNYHCVASGTVVDAGQGGGASGGGGGATGGGGAMGGGMAGGGGAMGGGGGVMGGGGGVTGGGGGAASCGGVNCDGCCLFGRTCVPWQATSVSNCGANGEACVACPVGQLCTAGACVTPDAGTSLVGGPCEGPDDCGFGGMCILDSQGFPGGYCYRYCEGEPCPSGAQCVEAQTQSGDIINVCLASCPTGNECRPGYLCDQGLCLP